MDMVAKSISTDKVGVGDRFLCLCFQVKDHFVYSCSADGVIKVFELRDTSMHTVFVSENVKLEGSPRAAVIWRNIRSLAVANQMLYFGDEGMNVKVLNWKDGECDTSSAFGPELKADKRPCSPLFPSAVSTVLILYCYLSGTLHKLSNHLSEFGITDAMVAHENLLLSSGFDLDNGIGYINGECWFVFLFRC